MSIRRKLKSQISSPPKKTQPETMPTNFSLISCHLKPIIMQHWRSHIWDCGTNGWHWTITTRPFWPKPTKKMRLSISYVKNWGRRADIRLPCSSTPRPRPTKARTKQLWCTTKAPPYNRTRSPTSPRAQVWATGTPCTQIKTSMSAQPAAMLDSFWQ